MQVQKINALALDLMKQGLATARDQAVVMAEQMLARKDYTKLTIQMDGTPTSSPERAHEAQQQPSQSATALDQQTIQTILEKNSEFLVKKIKDFQEQITKLETQVKEMQSQAQSRALIREVPARNEDNQQKLRAAQQVSSSSSNHPRSGSFSPGDVSIEKIFYTGSRKQ